jgi:hypothetical protein
MAPFVTSLIDFHLLQFLLGFDWFCYQISIIVQTIFRCIFALSFTSGSVTHSHFLLAPHIYCTHSTFHLLLTFDHVALFSFEC